MAMEPPMVPPFDLPLCLLLAKAGAVSPTWRARPAGTAGRRCAIRAGRCQARGEPPAGAWAHLDLHLDHG